MSISVELSQLQALHEAGHLSQGEYEQAKRKLLGEADGGLLNSVKGLHRSQTDRWLGGVCGGLAESFGAPSWLLRLIFALLVFGAGTGVLVYVLAWVFLPLEKTASSVRLPAA